MMGWVFSLFMITGFAACLIRGEPAEALRLISEGADSSVRLCLSLAGSYLLWTGLLNIAAEAGLVEKLAKLMRRPLGRLMPDIGGAAAPVSLNLAANFLGLGNAATPFGLKSMEKLAARSNGIASREICMFLALNSSAVELLPTSVIAVRTACGSADPFSVVVPTFLSSVCAAITAVLCCKFFEGVSR